MKIFKIIIINIIVIFLIIISAEMYSLKYIWSDNKKIDKIALTTYYEALFKTISVEEYYNKLYNKVPVDGTFCPNFRPDENLQSNKPPVIFMGCSFTYGDNLQENETISSQFAKLTGRPVYNRACRGWGLSQFLYQAEREDFYTQFKSEPEFIIYTLIYDHINRLDKHKIIPLGKELQPKYKVKNNKLVRVKPKFWDYLFVVQQYQYHKNMIRNRVTNELLKLYFTQTEKEIRKHWKKTKLIIFVYGEIFAYEQALKELENEKLYRVIWAKDLSDINLTDEKYRVDGWHPTDEIWKIFVPLLNKKLMQI